jgi:hypothetical protein
LEVCVEGNEIDAGKTFINHTIDGIASASADSNNTNFCSSTS